MTNDSIAKVSVLDLMKQMAEEDSPGIIRLPDENVTAIDVHKFNGTITFGIPLHFATKLALNPGKYLCQCFILEIDAATQTAVAILDEQEGATA